MVALGTIAWQARPPKGEGDAWVTVVLEDDMVVATSCSSWRVHYDVASGLETARHFTKSTSGTAAVGDQVDSGADCRMLSQAVIKRSRSTWPRTANARCSAT